MIGSLSKTLAAATVTRSVSSAKGPEVPGLAAPPEFSHETVEHRARLGLALLQRRADDIGEIADILGDGEIMLHEAFDRRQAVAGRIAQPLRDEALQIEAQALLGAPGDEMHGAADFPQESLAAAKQPQFLLAEQANADQFLRVLDAIGVFGDPEQGVQIAQAALALLDVGLDQIARGAGALYPLVALGKLGGDEFRRAVAHDLVVETRQHSVEKASIAEDETGFEQGGADGHVRPGLLDALVQRAGGVADLLLQVPQEIEHGLDDQFVARLGMAPAAGRASRCRSPAQAFPAHSRPPRRRRVFLWPRRDGYA